MASFACQRCGACCRWPGSVLLEEADLAAAAAALGMATGEFIAAHAELARNRAQLTLKERADGACEFLDPDGRCRIYAARPKQCRDFPHGWRVEGCPGGGPDPGARGTPFETFSPPVKQCGCPAQDLLSKRRRGAYLVSQK